MTPDRGNFGSVDHDPNRAVDADGFEFSEFNGVQQLVGSQFVISIGSIHAGPKELVATQVKSTRGKDDVAVPRMRAFGAVTLLFGMCPGSHQRKGRSFDSRTRSTVRTSRDLCLSGKLLPNLAPSPISVPPRIVLRAGSGNIVERNRADPGRER